MRLAALRKMAAEMMDRVNIFVPRFDAANGDVVDLGYMTKDQMRQYLGLSAPTDGMKLDGTPIGATHYRQRVVQGMVTREVSMDGGATWAKDESFLPHPHRDYSLSAEEQQRIYDQMRADAPKADKAAKEIREWMAANSADVPCTCPSDVLLSRGCQCGGK